jgi:hypothetical protein
MITTYVANSTTLHIDLAEAIMVERARFTVEEFDAAVDEAVSAGMIKEEGSWLINVR